MLATLLIWLYTCFLCYIYGLLFLRLIQRLLRIQAGMPAFALVLVTGLVVLTVLTSFFSLFFQVGLLINLLLIGGALLAIAIGRIPLPALARPTSLLPLVVLVLAVLVALENATHRPLNPDTNIYHAQTIRWIETYPVVPGLGNLHGRLAFNSAWLLSNALFSLSFLGSRSFHLTAGVLFVVVLLYFWKGFQVIAKGEYKPSALLGLLFFPLAFSLLGAEISSPGTDFPVSLLLWLIAVLWVEQLEQEQPFHQVLIVLFGAFVVTVKFSAAPVLLLALFFCGVALFRGQKLRFVVMVVCIGVVLLPFLLRNIIMSGYLLYPFPNVDIFSFDWKVPLERVTDERAGIIAWARFPRMDTSQAMAMPFDQWFPQWLANQTLNRRLMLFASLLSVLIAIPSMLFRLQPRRYWLGWLTFYIGVWFWLFNAPDFRFGFGFLISAILLAGVPLVSLLFTGRKLSPALVSGIWSGLVLAFLLLTLATSLEPQTLANRLLLPADYDHVATQSCALKNGTVFCAKSYNACSYDSFPCIPVARPEVELRGATLREGFRTAP